MKKFKILLIIVTTNIVIYNKNIFSIQNQNHYRSKTLIELAYMLQEVNNYNQIIPKNKSIRIKKRFTKKEKNKGFPTKNEMPFGTFNIHYSKYPNELIITIVESLINFIQEANYNLFIMKKNNGIYALKTHNKTITLNEPYHIFYKFRKNNLIKIVNFYYKKDPANSNLRKKIPDRNIIRRWVIKFICSTEGQKFLKKLYKKTNLT